MGFLNPLWLLLGTAIAVPLILHLLQRHQGPRVVFPAVRYLRRAEREHARRIRLRQILLLLLRIAIIILITLVAARPFLRGAGAGHEPTAMVLVLDNSLSSGLVSGDRRVLDELKDRALETLSRAGSDDRFWLLRAGSPWEPALPGDAATIAVRVRETHPSAASADIVAAVARARAILAHGAEGRASEIQILSDLQASAFRGTLEQDDTEPGVLLWSARRSTESNASVEAVSVGGGLAPRAGERSMVAATIGGNARDSVNVRLSLDGRIVGAAVTRPGSVAIIPFPARSASLVAGEVQIDADALRADDRRFFVATIAPPPRVTLTRATPFVSEALAVLGDAGRIVPSARGGDVVIAPAGADGGLAGGTGSIVILAPESPLELPAVNRRLAALGVRWRMEQRTATGELGFANSGRGDELMRSLAGVRVMQHFSLARSGATAQDSVMLRLEDGSPWAVRGTRARGGRFVIVASPLSATATTLPASTAMVPLIDRLTGLWSAEDTPRAEALPGERVALPREADAVIDPAGIRHAVRGGQTFNDATEPGVYRVAAGTNVIGAFVVNAARAESDLRYIDGRRAARALAPLRVKRADDAAAWQRSIYVSRVGREVWRTLAMLLLALLMVEMLAAASGSGARSHAGTPVPES